MDLPAVVAEMSTAGCSARQMADVLLERALALESGRPRDDISILVLRVQPGEGGQVRRLSVQMPIP
ncbi:MAG TPA: hypothetical protein EYH30_11510 [Anaerolineales bacterium]|nr:hypothetical protein [Anaerolineales bacterium]